MMRKHGDYSRDLAGFAIRILRAVWLWADALTWEQVRLRIAQGIALGVLIWLIYLGMGIGFHRAAAKSTDQMWRCMEAQHQRLTALETNDQLRTATTLNAMATVSLVTLNQEQNKILRGYAGRFHATGPTMVAGTELPPLYGE